MSSVPIRCTDESGVALIGDAAHAMSPQLGTGASLALAADWTLAASLQSSATVPDALRTYHRARRAHLRWYRWTTRAMTPVFQSDPTALSWARDRFAKPLTKVPMVRDQMVTLFSGVQTSPFTQWQLPEMTYTS